MTESDSNRRRAPNGIGQLLDLYGLAHPWARVVKVTLQMVIGVWVIGWLVLKCFQELSFTPTFAESVLDGVGVLLALAAAVELAYTLFTEGPDEALDPLLLALSASVIIGVGKVTDFTMERVLPLLVLVSLLTVLFAVRKYLAERPEESWPPRAKVRALRRHPLLIISTLVLLVAWALGVVVWVNIGN